MQRAKVCDTAQSLCVTPQYQQIYVNAIAAPEGDGGAASEFRTITAALIAAHDSGMPTDINVAAGTYDRNLGESFPLVVDGGIRIRGAGSSKTFIIGTYDGLMPASALTVAIGDTMHLNRLSGFTLKPDPTTLLTGLTALECNSGNATDDGTAAPNTILEDVVVDPSYGLGIVVSTSQTDASPGCNLSLLHSTIQSSWGVSAGGCANGQDHGPVGLQIGDGTNPGQNTFLLSATSVVISDCIASAAIRNNTFRFVGIGVQIAQPLRASGKKNHFVIQGNHFDRITRAGVNLVGGSVIVDDLSDNFFSDVTAPPTSGFVGTGLLIEGLKEDGFARVAKARRNWFFGNDIGVKFSSLFDYLAKFGVSDFGTPADFGGNSFRCNSQTGTQDGGDVIVDLNPTAETTLPFAGNTWDHSSPTTEHLSTRKSGTDYTLPDKIAPDAGDTILLDVTHAVGPPDEDCPIGRIE